MKTRIARFRDLVSTKARRQVAAAGVNGSVLEQFAHRNAGFSYRVLWISRAHNDLCILANPKVPREKAEAVRAALVGMAKDPNGRRILEAGADLVRDADAPGFVASDNRDYADYRAFYERTRVKPVHVD